MSDNPTLYRETVCTSDIGTRDGGCPLLNHTLKVIDGDLVAVHMEPVEIERYLTMTDPRRRAAMGNLHLPNGRYAVIRIGDLSDE